MISKKVLFVVAGKEFQPIEYSIPKNLLEQAGFTVETASDVPETAIAQDGTQAHVDFILPGIEIVDYDGIFFVGGPGALEHLDNDISYAVINRAVQEEKIVGAICVATRILARAGVLRDRQATGWNGDNELPAIYQEHKVHFVPKDVVIDGNIITATGPNAAREYAELIITLLQDKADRE